MKSKSYLNCVPIEKKSIVFRLVQFCCNIILKELFFRSCCESFAKNRSLYLINISSPENDRRVYFK